MSSSGLQRAGLIVIVNLALTLVLLAIAELVCRRLEQAGIDKDMPAPLRNLPPRVPGELRVFAFGGSTVFGVPVPEIGFVAQLRYWLQRRHPDRDIRLYNYGWWGTDTAFALRQLTHRLDDQPDLVIVITGHNEFLGSPPTGEIGRIKQTLSPRLAALRLMQTGLRPLAPGTPSTVLPCQVAAWDRDATYFATTMAAFEHSMDLIVQRVSERGIPLIVATLPSNLSDWPPVYKRLAGRDRRYGATISRIQQLLRQRRDDDAAGAVRSGFVSYPEDAMLYFLQGQMQSANGAYTDARESFVRARDLDPIPYRATSQINSIIRRAAAGRAAVHLVDLERTYEEHATNGLVGYDLIADNVHATPLGDSITAQTIIAAMSAIGFLPAAHADNDVCCPIDTFLAAVGYLDPASPLRLRAVLANAKYAMKTPFLNLDASRMYLLEAMQLDDHAWTVWANLATLAYLEGDESTGSMALRRARQLHPEPFDLDDRALTPYLKEALEVSAGHMDCGPPF